MKEVRPLQMLKNVLQKEVYGWHLRSCLYSIAVERRSVKNNIVGLLLEKKY